jgi:two-component system chemotaxis response regulator CheB
LDLAVKPDISRKGAREFVDKIKLLSKIKVNTRIGRRAMREIKLVGKLSFEGGEVDRIVAIAASTGGPEALSIILSSLPAGFPCPVVIAQHISDGFVAGMAEWLQKLSKLSVKSPAEGEPLLPGTVYIAPSEKHMEIAGSKTITLAERQENDIYHPSCDRLLSSAARAFGSRSIGVILTGMGRDGAWGMEKIKKAGGTTIAQDEKTSIVFGMPKIAIETGCIDKVLPIEEISGEIVRTLTSRPMALSS